MLDVINNTNLSPATTMEYPLPTGVSAIPKHLLDLRPDSEIDHALLHPPPITSEKNIWFFWHQGYARMHPYTRRNVRAWHRRFAPHGWTIRVVDRQPDSALNIGNFLDLTDPTVFPRAFVDGTIGGDYAPQHTSDLVRWPLLLRYGGVYADVGLMQIGDLEGLWATTVGAPRSAVEVLSYDGGYGTVNTLCNYFLAARKGNALFARCHKLFLELWARDGGKTSTDGMHADPLLKPVPMQGNEGLAYTDADGREVSGREAMEQLTDYIAQGQVMTLVLNLVDEEGGWNGLEYARDHVYAMEFMVGAQLINDLTAWDGKRAYELMSLHLPKDGEEEGADQAKAREIVESCLQKSFAFKLAHGLIIRVYKYTLGSLWRANEGSDDVPGTYAHWLRHGMIYWCQDELPKRVQLQVPKALKVGPLLRES